jgi:hypothetical protein
LVAIDGSRIGLLCRPRLKPALHVFAIVLADFQCKRQPSTTSTAVITAVYAQLGAVSTGFASFG